MSPPLRVKSPLGKALPSRAGHVFIDETHEAVKGHHRARDHVVEAFAAFSDVAVLKAHVGKPCGGGHFRGNADFFADTVDEVEAAFGIHDCEGYARKAAAGADVEDGRGRCERPPQSRKRQRMEHVLGVEVVDVFAGDDVDARVPFGVKLAEGGELPALVFGELGECGGDDVG